MVRLNAIVGGIEFLKVPGTSPTAGWGSPLYSYTVYVEPQIDIDRRRFARQVDEILADERGWIRGGKVAFKRVEEGANTQVCLSTPSTVDKLCAPLNTAGEVSCCQGTRVVLNIKRWKHAVEHWTGPLKTYRQMVVNHEFGHRIGKPHRWCPANGGLAPVMQQQTYSLQGCRANSWPLDDEL